MFAFLFFSLIFLTTSLIQERIKQRHLKALARFTYNLDPMRKHVLVAHGIVSGSGYDPIKPFDIYVYDMAHEEASKSGNTDMLVFHSSTDAPVVDFYENIIVNGVIIDNFDYEDIRGYLELPITN